ncbi:MAG: DNA ligase-associated DEXH box helicase, partial [Verrucomicrobiota bacterium]
LGGGFEADAFYEEVRTAAGYRDLGRDAWMWALDFVTRGGEALEAYEQFNRVQAREGRFTVPSRRIATLHRMSVGTIASDQDVVVRYQKGGKLGSVEERFIAGLRPGDTFHLSGKCLELRRVRDMTAYVRRAKPGKGSVPSWIGGRLPLSSRLAAGVRQQLYRAGSASDDPIGLEEIFQIQRRWSVVPSPDELLIEQTQTREGHHLFVFALEGRSVHDGLSTLMAYRLSRGQPITLRTFATDYGFEFQSREPLAFDHDVWAGLCDPRNALDDLIAGLNAAELAQRQFREIARVAGLVFQGYPGRRKMTRQIQASSHLLYEVFERYDPENRLLEQARREWLIHQMEWRRLEQVLEALTRRRPVVHQTPKLTPLAFPIWAERTHGQVSSETWVDRVRRMVVQCEKAADR